jgi:hypothetical protein
LVRGLLRLAYGQTGGFGMQVRVAASFDSTTAVWAIKGSWIGMSSCAERRGIDVLIRRADD